MAMTITFTPWWTASTAVGVGSLGPTTQPPGVELRAPGSMDTGTSSAREHARERVVVGIRDHQ